MTQKTLPINQSALTYEDRVVIRWWSGQEIPDSGPIKINLTKDEYHDFLDLMTMLGQSIVYGRR